MTCNYKAMADFLTYWKRQAALKILPLHALGKAGEKEPYSCLFHCQLNNFRKDDLSK
jgi:hypothetical protein